MSSSRRQHGSVIARPKNIAGERMLFRRFLCSECADRVIGLPSRAASARHIGTPSTAFGGPPPRRGRLSPECRIFMSHICFAVLSTRIQDRLRRPSSSEISTLSSELCRAAAWPPPPLSAVLFPDEWPLLGWSRCMRRSRRACPVPGHLGFFRQLFL